MTTEKESPTNITIPVVFPITLTFTDGVKNHPEMGAHTMSLASADITADTILKMVKFTIRDKIMNARNSHISAVKANPKKTLDKDALWKAVDGVFKAITAGEFEKGGTGGRKSIHRQALERTIDRFTGLRAMLKGSEWTEFYDTRTTTKLLQTACDRINAEWDKQEAAMIKENENRLSLDFEAEADDVVDELEPEVEPEAKPEVEPEAK